MKQLINKIIWSLLLCGFMLPTKVSAQTPEEIKRANENLNKTDSKKRKQGMWFYRIPAKFGDPGYMEFGSYKDNQKTGIWYKLSSDAQLMAIENYKKGLLDGQAQYFENGKLAIIGNYRGIYSKYAYDTFNVIHPETMLDTLVVVPSERGTTKHGTWRYYNPMSGHLVREEEYQVDLLLKEQDFTLPTVKEKSDNSFKLPHEGGAGKGWKTNGTKSRSSLTK